MRKPTAAVWRKIGQAFETPFDQRNRRQRELTTFGKCRKGLCLVVGSLVLYNKHYYEFRNWTQEAWLRDDSKDRCFVWPRTNAGDKQRALFCYLMSRVEETGGF